MLIAGKKQDCINWLFIQLKMLGKKHQNNISLNVKRQKRSITTEIHDQKPQ
jgi:hypothetical protein